MKKLILAACAALALASCAPVGAPTSGLPIPSTRGTVIDEQAMIALELGYSTMAQSFIVARDRGLLPADRLEQVRQRILRAADLLDAARAAYAAGDAETFSAKAVAFIALQAEVNRLLPQP